MSVGVKLDVAKVGDVQRMQCSITVSDTSDVELADMVLELCKHYFGKVEVVETSITFEQGRDSRGEQLSGTFNCPICGVGTPHSHSEAERTGRDDAWQQP